MTDYTTMRVSIDARDAVNDHRHDMANRAAGEGYRQISQSEAIVDMRRELMRLREENEKLKKGLTCTAK
jgi:hypothetical protein